MSYYMPFEKTYIPARFIRRLNRFLIEASVDGEHKPVLALLHDPGRL